MGTLVKVWGERFLGIFLTGGTLGGWIFSSLADRWGRNPVMVLTILFYSIFSGLTAFATELWHVGALRFLVAIGVGGEWAVGATLVAEVFPQHTRERAGGIFHATSVAGVWLAAAVGLATFWGVVVAGQNLAEDLLRKLDATLDTISARGKSCSALSRRQVRPWECWRWDH